MKQNGTIIGLAGVLAAASLAAGCVPALNYGSVPPEPEFTTRYTTTTASTAPRKPFTTHKHSERTISWEEFSGTYRVYTTTKKKSTGTDDETGTGTYTGSGTNTGTGSDMTGSGVTGSGSTYDTEAGGSLHTTDMPQTVTTVKPSESEAPATQQTEHVQTEAPVTAPPQTEPPQTAPPQTAPPQTAAPVPDIED